jgi:hypothetical protein
VPLVHNTPVAKLDKSRKFEDIHLALIQNQQDSTSHYMVISDLHRSPPLFRDVIGDGACGWRCLAFAILHDEEQFWQIRQKVGKSLQLYADTDAVIEAPSGTTFWTRREYGNHLVANPRGKDLIHEAALIETAKVYAKTITVHVFQRVGHKWKVVHRLKYSDA